MERLLVQWTEFPSSLAGALGQLQNAAELADVTLACEGRRLLAHKLVLSACSPYFRDAFKENPCHHPIIILKDVRAQDVADLLSYMYRGEVDIEQDKLGSFVQTAELLQIKGLAGGVDIATRTHEARAPAVRRAKKKPQQQQDKTEVEQKRPKTGDTPTKKNKTVKSSPTKQQEDDGKSEDAKQNDSQDAAFVSEVKVKHEIEEPPDEEEVEQEDTDSFNDENRQSDLPLMSYENSMLARSLISGAQVVKNDSNSNILPSNISKLATQLTTPNILRELPVAQTSKHALEDTVVKIEKLSPKPEVMELEPEVLISEQEESITNVGNRNVITSKTSGQIAVRTDLPGTSQSNFNQANHAAICGDCPHCGTKYSNQSALKYHVRLMHSDLTNRLCCYLCPRSFTMRDTFKEHMWTSHGQRN